MSGADSRVYMDRRFECPECHCADMILNKKTLLKPMEYTCPNCKARLLAEPPRTPPPQPTLPTGGIMTTSDQMRERQDRRAA